MKNEALGWMGVGAGCCIGLWLAFNFQKTQEHSFQKKCKERAFFQSQVRNLRKDLTFLESYEEEIRYLKEKGWFVPKNRLLVGEFLENLCPILKKVVYRFDPETIKDLGDMVSFKVTQMTFEAESSLDIEMYAFIEKLLETFPGILISRELTLTRQNESPYGVKGKFIFDWVAEIGENGEEKVSF